MSSDAAITVSHLGKCYEIYRSPRDRLKQAVLPSLARLMGMETKSYFREFWALKDVSFAVQPGETFGIIGKNGSGKSTLLQILAGILSPTEGRVSVKGRVAALLELGSGFNPDFTGRENVFLNGQILGLTEKEIAARYDEIAEFADIGEFIDQPVKTYSSGMFLRLAFAVQAHIDASIVIVDEALAVGDVFFRQKCYARMEKLKASGAAVLLVSHSMPDIEQYCDRALLLDGGKSQFLGDSSEAAKRYYIIQQHGLGPERADHLRTSSVSTAGFESNACESLSELHLTAASGTFVGDERLTCIGISVTDRQGHPSRYFRQGDLVRFRHAYRLSSHVDVPIGGVVIANDRGVIVHGKNAWQCRSEVPVNLAPGSAILFEHDVELKLQPGDYTFEFGVATVPLAIWKKRSALSFDDWNNAHETLSVVTQAGAFSIGLAEEDGRSVLTHHGVADLPGTIHTRLINVHR